CLFGFSVAPRKCEGAHECKTKQIYSPSSLTLTHIFFIPLLLHPTSSSSHSSFIQPLLHPTSSSSHFSFIQPLLHPTSPSSNLSSTGTPKTNFSKIRDWYFSSIFHLNLVETGWIVRIPASLRSLLTALLRSEENGRYCRFCSSDWDNPQSPAAPT